MAVLLEAPYSQFFDDNGNPLSGGLVYTYSPGTTTNKATYTDYTGTVQASNPVVLDSAGRAAMWMVGSYRIDVKTSSGVLIRTVDNYTAPNATGDMAASIYDPANIQQQLVGLTAVQTLTNKTLTAPVIGGAADFGTSTIAGTPAFTTLDKAGATTSFTSNTTFGDLTGMSWVLNPGTYYIRFYGTVSQAAAGGFKIQTTFSGTATHLATATVLNAGATSFVTSNVSSAFGSSIVTSTTGTSNAYFMDDVIIVTVAGTYKLQGAQNVSNATPTIFSPVATVRVMS